MTDWDQAADEWRWPGVDVIACPDCWGSGFDPTTAEVDVKACQRCEGSGCVQASDVHSN